MSGGGPVAHPLPAPGDDVVIRWWAGDWCEVSGVVDFVEASSDDPGEAVLGLVGDDSNVWFAADVTTINGRRIRP
jgi:hypothetical protein